MSSEICRNKYEPNADKPEQIPKKSGIYIICAQNIENLPLKMADLKYFSLKGFIILYVGITNNLRGRYRKHFEKNARQSTLRKSFGVLFGYRKEQRPNELGTNKYKFVYEDESSLSNWMKENLVFYYMVLDRPKELETELIAKYAPPLNIEENTQPSNHEFRKELHNLRKIKENP